jgi:pyruvate dehydrogenase E2 component (dihydrolipoamide acetyltransferase)
MEIETDKVTVEIEAPGAGVLSDVRADPGTDVPVGEVVALLLGSEAAPTAPLRQAPAATPRASPVARRIAAEHGIDLSTVVGSGLDGAVTAVDIETLLRDGQPVGDSEYEIRELTGIRRLTAERLSASYREAPHFDVFLSVDASDLLAAIRPPHESARMTITAAIAFLTVRALAEHPNLNAHFVNGQLRIFRPVHLGVAVALDEGLIVPVIRDAQRKLAGELQLELAELVERARDHRLGRVDVGGSTFTVTNLGMFGIDRFTAILNPPEVAILTVGRCRELPAVVGDSVVPRPMVDLTLCADHRALDGAAAASFLTCLAGLMLAPAVLADHRESGGTSEASL